MITNITHNYGNTNHTPRLRSKSGHMQHARQINTHIRLDTISANYVRPRFPLGWISWTQAEWGGGVKLCRIKCWEIGFVKVALNYRVSACYELVSKFFNYLTLLVGDFSGWKRARKLEVVRGS